LRLCDNRQRDANRRPATKFAFRLHPSAVKLRDVFDNRQAEAGATEFAAARFVRAIESLENPRQIFAANPNAVIADAKHYFAIAPLGLQADLATHARVFHRVIEQVVENFSEARFVRANDGTILRYIRSEEHTSELQSRGHLVCR